jgi:hypothetical protein
MEIVAYCALSKTIITINAWKIQFPSILLFAAEMLANMFRRNKDKLSK